MKRQFQQSILELPNVKSQRVAREAAENSARELNIEGEEIVIATLAKAFFDEVDFGSKRWKDSPEYEEVFTQAKRHLMVLEAHGEELFHNNTVPSVVKAAMLSTLCLDRSEGVDDGALALITDAEFSVSEYAKDIEVQPPELRAIVYALVLEEMIGAYAKMHFEYENLLDDEVLNPVYFTNYLHEYVPYLQNVSKDSAFGEFIHKIGGDIAEFLEVDKLPQPNVTYLDGAAGKKIRSHTAQNLDIAPTHDHIWLSPPE